LQEVFRPAEGNTVLVQGDVEAITPVGSDSLSAFS
jgi:hypothetical protein